MCNHIGLAEPKLIGLAEFELDPWSMLVLFSSAL